MRVTVGGGARPPSFPKFTMSYKDVVYAPAERADTLPLFHRLNMELDLQSLFGLLCTDVLMGWDPATPPTTRIWAHILGRYWSAKIDDISLKPHALFLLSPTFHWYIGACFLTVPLPPSLLPLPGFIYSIHKCIYLGAVWEYPLCWKAEKMQ